jgi:hypothetical protein
MLHLTMKGAILVPHGAVSFVSRDVARAPEAGGIKAARFM